MPVPGQSAHTAVPTAPPLLHLRHVKIQQKAPRMFVWLPERIPSCPILGSFVSLSEGLRGCLDRCGRCRALLHVVHDQHKCCLLYTSDAADDM
eukprot:13560494-Alexandrium_andersonii.AAC.1